MNDAKFPTTAQELQSYIAQKLKDHDVDEGRFPVAVDDVAWFVAVTEARTILNAYTTKDLAGMLLTGCPPINEQHIPEWLNTISEGEEADYAFEQLDDMIGNFYNVPAISDDESDSDDE